MARRRTPAPDRKPAPLALGPALARTFHIRCATRQGTAFAIDVDGRQYLVTATHLLRGLKEGAVVQILHAGKWKPLDVQVVGYGPPQVDVAVLALKFRIALPELSVTPSMTGLVLGQDALCLGFPRAEWLPAAAQAQKFPVPFVKKVCVAALPEAGAVVRGIYLSGPGGEGYAGGPVVFHHVGREDLCVAGVLSAFDCEGEPVYLGTDQVQLNARHQADVVVAYDIRHALDVINLNPVGFELKPA